MSASANQIDELIKIDGEVVDVRKATKLEVIALRNRLNGEIAEIAAQIDAAKARAQATGEYADPEWFRRAVAAKRYKGADVQRANQALSLIKERDTRRFESVFIDVARRHLDKGTFTMLMDLAHDELPNRSDV
jgi:hypothetical protein